MSAAADDSQLFAGVRFALAGFDPISEPQYRSEMVRRGGTDAGGGGAACTHLVVCDLLYDDPVCVAARADGTKVVTELWVDETLDLGVMADADHVLYLPVRDLNGIPGCQDLNICLTGYQSNGRREISRMVSKMGAQFSKPLEANKVTHLICYKFEGEKYELAKRMKINLVNHRWLEDCLKAWEILPIDSYTKSGWEIERMEAQAKDSEDEAEDVGRGPSSSGIARSTPITKNRIRTHVDPGLHAPSTISTGNAEVVAGRHLDTPQQISKAEDLSKSSLDIRTDIQRTPNRNVVTVSADTDVLGSIHPPINPIGNEEAPSDKVSRHKAKDDDKTALDTRVSALCAPIINQGKVCSEPHAHQSFVKPAILVDNIDNIDGKSLDNANQSSVNNVHWSTPSEENCSDNTLSSSNITRMVDKKGDGRVADLDPTVGQSETIQSPTLCKVNSRKIGSTSSKNISYSTRRSRKPVSTEGSLKSIQQTVSSRSYEETTPGVGLNTSPIKKNDHTISELPEAQGPRDEVKKHVDRSGRALFQRKSRLSSTSPKLSNACTDSSTELTIRPSISARSSEAATLSDHGRNSAGSNEFNGNQDSDPMEKQKPSSFKNNIMSNRRTSLRLARSSEVEKLPQNFANENKMESLSMAKSPARHVATAERGYTVSPPASSEVRKASLILSLQNGGDSPQADKIDVPPNSEPDKVVSHTTLESCPKEIPVTTLTRKNGTVFQKVSTSRARNADAKRSRDSGNETDVVFVENKKVAASHENVEAELGKNYTSLSSAECTTSFPEEILSNRARDAAAKSSLVANFEMIDVLAVSETEVANVISLENKVKYPRKPSSSASTDEYQRASSENVLNSITRNTAAKASQTTDTKMTDTPIIDKTEIIPLKSNYHEVVPPENAGAHPKILSSNASADDRETCTPNGVAKKKVRKAAAKRKVSSLQQHKVGSDPCKTSSAFPSEDKDAAPKRAAESSTDAGKLTVDQDPQNANEYGATNTDGKFCKDAREERSEDRQNTNSGSSKRPKTAHLLDGATDHSKENIPDGATDHSKEKIPAYTNPPLKSKNRNNHMTSKCIKKAEQSGKKVLGERNLIDEYGCGTLTVLEPTWFILSGHRLLRKEFRSILRRLKGRVCRDSHHWSFQATHFITPELRRTEKFFAAAAAGRWILKPDYLTACNEAGKLVEEEPFEWHGNGLNNGDAISLDAPRKWRQLRQRTGHGAFYGMQIIIYGECVSPSLDTLRRAVRAGDGTILATSPPYTRFLKDSVDFAVVSAGMPSADAWVQEFQSHNIPCVSADYLVEFVCKPGHPLDKHVLFNMHQLVDKSLHKLRKAAAFEGSSAEQSCSAVAVDVGRRTLEKVKGLR